MQQPTVWSATQIHRPSSVSAELSGTPSETTWKELSHSACVKRPALAANQTKNRIQGDTDDIQGTQWLVPYQPSRTLQSQDSNLLTVQNARLQSYGARSFANAVPKLWKSLPDHIRHIQFEAKFKKA